MAVRLPPSGETGDDRYLPLAEINVTPMVDVMLVLLVIFMVAAPLLTVGVPINLPKTSAAQVTVPPKLDLSKAIAVVFAPPLPSPAPAQPEPPPAQPQIVEQPPPPPEPPPPAVEQPPLPPAPVAETPPPPSPPKPEPHLVAKPRPRPQPVQAQPLPQPMQQLPLPLPSPMPQTASIPSPPPAPTISPDYRTILSSWLQTHKRYPEEARQRGEEGRAVLRFRVDRSGRVLDYSVVSSTGFADLDAAVGSMMRGAMLPSFPPSMTEPEIEVSVTIRFGLSR